MKSRLSSREAIQDSSLTVVCKLLGSLSVAVGFTFVAGCVAMCFTSLLFDQLDKMKPCLLLLCGRALKRKNFMHT